MNKLLTSTEESRSPPGLFRMSSTSRFMPLSSSFCKALSTSLAVLPWNWMIFTYPMSPSSILDFTLWTLITSRVMVNSFGLSQPSRKISSRTWVFLGPRIRSTASSMLMSFVHSSLIFRILSPAAIPARSAGVSSMGEMTVSCWFLMPIWMPTPWNSPLMSMLISLNARSDI